MLVYFQINLSIIEAFISPLSLSHGVCPWILTEPRSILCCRWSKSRFVITGCIELHQIASLCSRPSIPSSTRGKHKQNNENASRFFLSPSVCPLISCPQPIRLVQSLLPLHPKGKTFFPFISLNIFKYKQATKLKLKPERKKKKTTSTIATFPENFLGADYFHFSFFLWFFFPFISIIWNCGSQGD